MWCKFLGRDVPLQDLTAATLKVTQWLIAMAEGEGTAYPNEVEVTQEITQEDVAYFLAFLAPAVVPYMEQMEREIDLTARHGGPLVG
jgi:hypothetical protein